MSHAVAEITQMAERHNTHATEISRALNNYTELSVLLAKYGQQHEVRHIMKNDPELRKRQPLCQKLIPCFFALHLL